MTKEQEDDYEGELSRYAIYVVNPKALHPKGDKSWHEAVNRRRVYETSRDGIGVCLRALYAEDEVPRGWRVGIFDRLDRFWIVNPFV